MFLFDNIAIQPRRQINDQFTYKVFSRKPEMCKIEQTFFYFVIRQIQVQLQSLMQGQMDGKNIEKLQEKVVQIDGEQSFDLLVSKHMIPPPLMLLPKPISHKPKSLLPMLPLPNFVGIIPNFQPLDKMILLPKAQETLMFRWIGEAFDNIIYRKYEQQSYRKIDNIDEHWNIWACDLVKLNGKKQNQVEQQKEILPFYTPQNNQDLTLVFQSRFQCGNLSLVSKVSDEEYNLLLQNDINTNGYSQWFFFKVSNTRRSHRTKFKILNQYKQNNLYKMGMKIIIYSKRQSQEKNISWHRGGQNIKYYENGYTKSSINFKPYFTLEWEYEFNYTNDQVYFAYSYPYTYSNQQSVFSKIENDPFLRTICRRSSLCRTLAGNSVDVMTITQNHPYQDIDKPYIFITARIHPGESISSYVCNGIIQYLLSSHQNARKLRRNFIFKIVPMLNPDGVIHGNYRSNISGYDINKKWQNPSKIYHPQIYYLKKFILGIQQIGEVILFCDLHGHSMKKNAFVYGCHDTFDIQKGKQFPLLMSKLFKGFSFKDCSFLNKNEEQGTCRTVLSKRLNHCNVYALESSFCGPEYQNIHFTVKHFEELGEKFCEAILIYFHDKIRLLHVQAAMKQKSYFPNQDSSYQSLPDYKQLRTTTQNDMASFRNRVNSENSQLSQRQQDINNVLEQRVIKKYLMLRYMRPTTIGSRRSNIHIRKVQSKDLHKDLNKIRMLEQGNGNVFSHSPVKRKQLYESPLKIDKNIKVLNIIHEKKQVQQKLFEPIDIVQLGFTNKRQKSTVKVIYQTEKIVRQPQRQSIKIILNKNFQFKEKNEIDDRSQSVFKNTFLRSLPKPQKKQKKTISDLLIRKSLPNTQQKNAVSLFNSVLSSLRKHKK